ncbi:hypothetical protein GWI33_002241 [Rhynchophorus ferrugineus]|uniref:Uncharacterized protein n=1 Tax=Rhynchophorus ferrugineus TaxID=354439 RepID=A0A834MHP3_RHYFE|nr:hypothetical protein GWI33_002241 [Rhynchophorus ferrugineus]
MTLSETYRGPTPERAVYVEMPCVQDYPPYSSDSDLETIERIFHCPRERSSNGFSSRYIRSKRQVEKSLSNRALSERSPTSDDALLRRATFESRHRNNGGGPSVGSRKYHFDKGSRTVK